MSLSTCDYRAFADGQRASEKGLLEENTEYVIVSALKLSKGDLAELH